MDRNTPISFTIGHTPEGMPIVYDSAAAGNFHTLLLGNSGAGKTYCIQQMATRFWAEGCTIIALDTQGDLQFDKFPEDCKQQLSPEHFNTIEFDYLNSDVGINPLQMVVTGQTSDYQFSLYNAVHSISLFNDDLGTHQESLLISLIQEVYAKFGIHRDDMGSWGLPSPTLADLLDIVNDRLRAVSSGIDFDIFEELSVLRKSLKKEIKGEKDPTEAKDRLMTRFEAFVDRDMYDVDNEKILSLGSKSRLLSIQSLLQKMIDSRLFEGTNFVVKAKRFNVFKMNNIHPSQYKILFDLILYRTFQAAVRKSNGYLNPQRPDTILLFDEGKIFNSTANNPMGPMNRIATEGRKFGLGSLIGVQNPEQVSREIKSAIGTTLILPVVKSDMPKVKSLWMVPVEKQSLLVPKRDALFSTGNSQFQLIHAFQ